jgi:hypothetical protein
MDAKTILRGVILNHFKSLIDYVTSSFDVTHEKVTCEDIAQRYVLKGLLQGRQFVSASLMKQLFTILDPTVHSGTQTTHVRVTSQACAALAVLMQQFLTALWTLHKKEEHERTLPGLIHTLYAYYKQTGTKPSPFAFPKLIEEAKELFKTQWSDMCGRLKRCKVQVTKQRWMYKKLQFTTTVACALEQLHCIFASTATRQDSSSIILVKRPLAAEEKADSSDSDESDSDASALSMSESDSIECSDSDEATLQTHSAKKQKT